MTLLLSGCLFQSPQDLYRQPEKSAGYEKLNAVIQEVRTALEMEFDASAETAVILAGDNTATIQLQDLDGDGTRESAITFLRIPSIEKSIKIFIFTQIGEEYRVSAVVEGDGSAIYSIDYVDLNGSGYKELVVNWQISTGVYQLGVYTLDELMLPVSGGTEAAEAGPTVWGAAPAERAELLATELLLTRCSAATEGSSFSSGYRLLDIDRDTRSEVAVVRIDSAGVGSHVEVYGWKRWSHGQLGQRAIVCWHRVPDPYPSQLPGRRVLSTGSLCDQHPFRRPAGDRCALLSEWAADQSNNGSADRGKPGSHAGLY